MPVLSSDVDAAATEPPWDRLRALVLGGAGLIGSHVVRALLGRDVAVRVIVRPGNPAIALEDLPVERIPGDHLDPALLASALHDVDLLVHAAAPYPRSAFSASRQARDAAQAIRETLRVVKAHTPRSLLELPKSVRPQIAVEQAEGAARVARYQPERSLEIRGLVEDPGLMDLATAGRLNASLHPPLSRVAREPGLKRVVFVSSVTTIGRARGRAATEEDRFDVARDRSPYFRMKAEMEAEVLRAAVEGLPIVTVNPAFCVDAHDASGTAARLLVPIARGWMPFYLPGVVNAIAARDVGEAIVEALARGRTGCRYILSNETMASREFLERAARAAGAAPPRLPLPLPLAEGIAWMTEVARAATGARWPLFPVSGVRMLRHAQPLDASRARAELDLRRTPIDTALADAYRWYRERGMLPCAAI